MSNYELDRFPQPPDPPDEGKCLRCGVWISSDELLEDGCFNCDDLLIVDMKEFWQGRPKAKVFTTWYQFNRDTCQGVDTRLERYRPVHWTGCLTPPYFGHNWKPELIKAGDVNRITYE